MTIKAESIELNRVIRSKSHDDIEPVTEILTGGIEIIDALADEWREMCAEGPCDQPFFRPEWIAAYVRAFSPRGKLLLAIARINGRLSAVLPFIREWGLLNGLPVRKLRSATNLHSCRFDLIHGVNSEKSIRAIWQLLKATGNWDVIELQSVPQGGAAETLVQMAAEDRCPTGKWITGSSPYLPLPGNREGLNSPAQLLDPNFRAKLRKWMRKLNARGSVKLVRIDHHDPAILTLFYELEKTGWKGKTGTAIACDRRTRRFYDEISIIASKFGYLTNYILECDGRPIAVHFGLTYKDRFFVPKTTYDENYKDCAPGHLILEEILRDLINRGVTEFDFLGDAAQWKNKWTRDHRPHATCYIFRRGIIGRVLQAYKFRLIGNARRLKREWSGQLQPIRRRIENSIDKRRITGTVDLFIWKAFDRLADRLLPSRHHARNIDREFDSRFGVDTRGIVGLHGLQTVGDNRAHAKDYEQSKPAEFYRLMDFIKCLIEDDFEDYVFVDLGSGKGRALLLASRFPFKKIIGVEFAVELHLAALENIRNYRDPSQRCDNFELLNMDVVDFPMPDDNIIFYLYNPFDEVVLEQTLSNIQRSLEERPRRVFLVYCNSRHREAVGRYGFEAVKQLRWHTIYRGEGKNARTRNKRKSLNLTRF